MHIGMNMWVLYDLGPQVEEIFGTNRFVVFYLLSTVEGFWRARSGRIRYRLARRPGWPG